VFSVSADLVGRPVTVGPDAAWSVRVEVRAEAGAYVADVQLVTSLGEERRPLRAKGCDALADAVAVIVALALDSEVPPPPPPPTVTATRTATVARAPPRVVRPRPRRAAPAETSPWALSVEAEASAQLGLPDPGVGAGGLVGLRREGWSFGLGAQLLRSGLDPVAPDEAARVEVLAGVLRGCAPAWRGRPWHLDLCLRSSLGRARVFATGRAAGEEDVWWADVGAELGAGFEGQGGWAASARLRVLWPLARPTAVISLTSGDVEAFRTPPVGLGLGLSIRGDFFLTD